MICPECGVWVFPNWVRCYNCGFPLEDNLEEVDVMGLEEFSKKVWDIEKLSPNKIKQLMKQPIIETKIFKSKNNKFIITKTIITDIKPVKYYEKVLSNQG